jgi:FKBP-type peptidyl-prolyl cis-trans isomerase 2
LTEEGKEGAKLEKGAIIRLDFDLYVVSPDGKEELYDTTSEELAKKENIHDEKKVYDSVPLIVGHDRTVKGLDNSLINAKVGEEYNVEIPPADAAGERKPDLVELVSMREFTRDHKDEEPRIGMEVIRKGKKGMITGIAAGRIRIDYNNPLAGKTLKYRYKVVTLADTLEEKIKNVIHLDYGMSDDFVLTTSEDQVEIQLPEVCKYDPNWSLVKYKIVSDLRDILGIPKVRLVEEYVKKEDEKKEETPEDKKEEVSTEEKKEEALPEEKEIEKKEEEPKTDDKEIEDKEPEEKA